MTPATHKQLALGIHLRDDATFANYYAPMHSAQSLALETLRPLTAATQVPPERFVYLWGAEGAGTSHLLQAACHAADQAGLRCLYLPLDEVAGYAPEALLDELEQMELVCLDGLQYVMGQPNWDHALFHFYNRLREQAQSRLLVSAHCAPRDLSSALADLVSRMGWGTTIHLSPLSDTDKQQAFLLRAKARGMELSDETLAFIVHRAARDMHALFDCLHKLDALSLEEKRRVTIPFIKSVFGW